MLNYQVKHNRSDTLLVLLHGFMGSIETYDFVTSDEVDILTVDLPGHGLSINDEFEWSFDYIIDEIYQLLQSLKMKYHYQKVFMYGYSMGGRIALYYAAQYDLDGLILESASPGIENHDDQEKRRLIDKERGTAIIADYEGFIKEWEVLPLFKTYQTIDEQRVEKQRSIRLSHRPELLAKALKDYGTGSQPNMWLMLSEMTLPVLLLTGLLDKKFVDINHQMNERLQNSNHLTLKAGHTIHVEHPEIFDTIVIEFIKEAHHG